MGLIEKKPRVENFVILSDFFYCCEDELVINICNCQQIYGQQTENHCFPVLKHFFVVYKKM
jgi:hypothetical protein